ncbi:nuclear transport factor 2 family protein [Devosia sp. ZB163]|uniref:YybH family protein n=1 Tax=Devosia sp. ZB163 TaxID=3025938 RepID=UPI0023625881|nr:nuclear transport factor 2 family protein [Devosia sp. ZB163]MDC9826519.1 nuclear transport factor 2 family protein [Devosia sp. ZB163]
MSARDVLQAYTDRINRQDFDLLTDLIAPDATFWFTSGTHRGIDAIRAAFEATWQTMGPSERYWLDQLEWIAEGDSAAACIYRFNWEAVADGKPISGSGRGTTVLRRVDDRWWIVHEHLSRLPG